MTRENQIALFNEATEKAKVILQKKGNDYANEDILSNFKLAGSICGISPEINCLNLIATKVARLGVLLNSEKGPENESILDSEMDLFIYSFLLMCLTLEKRD
jgi:hypothetical protein